ncbi:MAG: PAS domain-containing sensor histidine kinase [Candidatus Thorarchaeota archaeon]|nr:PAS domain-containing sensor histidine kinase [Candidatus Thorarchaeota archaeon]
MARDRSTTSISSRLRDVLDANVQMVDDLGLLLLGLDPDGIIRVANEWFFTVLQLNHSDVIGHSFQDFISRVPDAVDLEDVRQQLVSGKLERYELVTKMHGEKDGIIKWVLSPIVSESLIIGIRATGVVVDDVIQLITDCCDDPFVYRGIIEQIPTGVLLVDKDERILYANPVASQILDKSLDELIHTKFTDLVLDEDKHIVGEQTQKRLRGEVSSYTVRIADGQGDIRYIQIEAAPYKNSQGIIEYTLGYIVDVTSMIQAQKTIDAERGKLRIIAEASNDAIVIIDDDFRVVFWNKAASALFGYDAEEVLFKRVVDIVSSKQTKQVVKRAMKLVGSTTVPKRLQNIRIPRRDGTFVDVQINMGHLELEGTRYTIGIFRDVTDKLKSEKMQEQQHRELQLYASLLRHDLRNEIGLILSNIDIARVLLNDEMSPELIEVFESTESVCSRILRILSTFGKPRESGSGDLRDIINKLVESQLSTYPRLTITVTGLSENQELPVVGTTLLPMVFENLIRNTVTYVGDDAHITFQVKKNDEDVEIIVKDDGSGISKGIRERLFQRGVTTRGTGLGLYLIREIITMLGGTIELLDSGPGEGAVFRIRVPLL